MALDAEKIQQLVRQNKLLKAKLQKMQEADSPAGDSQKLARENAELKKLLAEKEREASGDAATLLEEKKMENEVLREKIIEQSKETAKQEQEIKRLNETVTEIQMTNEILREKLIEQEKELAKKAERKTSSGKKKTSPPQSGGGAAKKDLSELRKKLEAEQAKVKELEKKLKDKAESKKKAGKVRTSTSADKQRLDKLLRDNQALTDELTQLKKARAKSRWRGVWAPETCDELDSLYQQQESLHHQINILQQERNFLESELQELRLQLGLTQTDTKGHSVSVTPVKSDLPATIKPLISDLLDSADPIIYMDWTLHKVDTGAWGKKTTCFLVLTTSQLILAAPGKKSFLTRIPREQLQQSFWNDVTGELIFYPSMPDAKISSVKLSCDQADELLALLHASTLSLQTEAEQKKEEEKKRDTNR